MYKNRYDWSELEKIATPEKWISIIGWWSSQFEIADLERNELKQKLVNLEVEYQKLLEPTREK